MLRKDKVDLLSHISLEELIPGDPFAVYLVGGGREVQRTKGMRKIALEGENEGREGGATPVMEE